MNQVEQWFSNDSPHLEYKQRWVNQYNFYINDAHWGPYVRADVPLLSVFGPHLFEPTPLACPSHAARRNRLRADEQRVLEMRQPNPSPKTGRFTDLTRSIDVRSEMAGYAVNIGCSSHRWRS